MTKVRQRDIKSREDIVKLVDAFYSRVFADEKLGVYFKGVDFSSHLAVMYNFWDNALFYNGSYSGNPMKVHSGIHSAMPFTEEHFTHWLMIFNVTVDELFKGKNAKHIKQRAWNIAEVMKAKLK